MRPSLYVLGARAGLSSRFFTGLARVINLSDDLSL
jgi:hypothetical protein